MPMVTSVGDYGHETGTSRSASAPVEDVSGLVPFCIPCDAPFFYPRPRCPRCHGRELEYRAPGSFTIRTFTWVYRPQSAEFEADIPILMLVCETGGAKIIAEGRGWTRERPPRIGGAARLIALAKPGGRVPAFEPEETR